MTVHRVTYVSTARLGLTDHDVSNIVETARVLNAPLGITGLLLFNKVNFLQTLEGPLERLQGLLWRISEDQRHAGVVVVQRENADSRAFEGWSMGFSTVEAAVDRQGRGPENGLALPDMVRRIPENLLSIYKSFDTLSVSRSVR